jgi:5-methylcytosine-specific restriction enzyme subunit McrC
MKILVLTEYQPLSIPRHEIPESVIDELQQKYSNQIEVTLHYSKAGEKWQLTSQGWVGYISLTPEFGIKLQPKVPIKNLFGMLNYAYNLKSFHFLEGLTDCQTLEEFYDRLATILASRICDRTRKGLYLTYQPKTNQLACIRGRIDVGYAIRKPWDTKLNCHYEDFTGDIEDNQILAWTLHCITRTDSCSDRVRPLVRQAYHSLQGFVTLQPFHGKDCIGRQYNRLNEDYRALHALCRFFLENSAPSSERGNYTTLPFLVNMANLYELFVAEWLKANLPNELILKVQEPIKISDTFNLHIDLVLCETETGITRYILDTKYKNPITKPANADLYQVVTYATAKHSDEAVLIYPDCLDKPLDASIGNIRVRSLTFSLENDLEQAGQRFLHDLLVSSPSPVAE